MSLFTDLNKANKIMMGLNESELAPQEGNLDEAKKPGKNDKLGDVKGKGVQGDQVDIEEACDPEDDDEEDMEEGKCVKKKKCESVEEPQESKVNESLELYKNALDIPDFILNEGDDLVKKYLLNVFDIDVDAE